MKFMESTSCRLLNFENSVFPTQRIEVGVLLHRKHAKTLGDIQY